MLNKQPVYTTVGSIYNPSKTIAIQPPTRRPRARRYPTAFSPPAGQESYTDSPASMLAVLSLKDRDYTMSPAPRQRTPQYSPLQQNLDRAASPRLVTTQAISSFAGLGMSAPSIRSGNEPAPTPPGFNLDTLDTDSVASEEALATGNIGVKGLANLASYPNPMQKGAQQLLAKARLAHVGLQRTHTSSPLHTTMDSGNGGAAFASSSGAPRPLTAGPPGHRHFRPSTLDSTSRAANVEETDIAQRLSNLDQIDVLEELCRLRAEEASGGSHGITNTRWAISENSGSANSRNSPQFGLQPASSARQTFPTPQAHVPRPSTLSSGDVEYHDTLPINEIEIYYPHGLPSNYKGVSQQSKRNGLNQRFYAGADGLVRNTHRIVREHDRRRHKNQVGVIGDGRERFRRCQESSANAQLEPIGIRDANRMEDSAHAGPLLNMMLETLLRYQESGDPDGPATSSAPTSFVPADPAWIDSSEGGNKSFFEQREAEQPTRRNTTRRFRRGY